MSKSETCNANTFGANRTKCCKYRFGYTNYFCDRCCSHQTVNVQGLYEYYDNSIQRFTGPMKSRSVNQLQAQYYKQGCRLGVMAGYYTLIETDSLINGNIASIQCSCLLKSCHYEYRLSLNKVIEFIFF